MKVETNWSYSDVAKAISHLNQWIIQRRFGSVHENEPEEHRTQEYLVKQESRFKALRKIQGEMIDELIKARGHED